VSRQLARLESDMDGRWVTARTPIGLGTLGVEVFHAVREGDGPRRRPQRRVGATPRGHGGERFALDSYRRLIKMFGSTVLSIDSHVFGDAIALLKVTRGCHDDIFLRADDLQHRCH
jgi:hypothetical protein